MYLYRITTLSIAITLLLLGQPSIAQNDNDLSGIIWKQKVIRRIDLVPKLDSNNRESERFSTDSAFFQPIFSQVKNGTISAYATYASPLTRKLSLREVNDSDALDRDQDSLTIMDPITKVEKTIAVRKGPDFANIHKVKILEEWSFYPYTGQTEFKVTGVAPVIDIYDDNNIYRGYQAMIWMRYDDVLPLINKYDQDHPGNIIASAIWGDYFSRDTKSETDPKESDNNSNGVWKKIVTRDIDLSAKNDTVRHWLDNIGADSSLFERIIVAMGAGKLPAYQSDDLNFSAKLPYRIVKPLSEYTLGIFINSVTQPYNRDTIVFDRNADFDKFHKYRILEVWYFDPLAKKTKVNIIGIAPLNVIYQDDTMTKLDPMFWLRYNDVRDIINNNNYGVLSYDQHSCENSIQGTIWENYFFSDIKPKTLK